MIDVNCVPCFQRQAHRLFKKYQVSESRREVLYKDFNHFLLNKGVNFPSPLSAQYLNKIIKAETGIEDLFLEEKNFYNNLLLKRYHELKKEILASEFPLKTALKYALAGNIIDFGPPHSFDLDRTFNEALNKRLAVDHSEALFEAIENSEMVLYLGDNAGEIVTDKLFIETMNHPNVVFAVRGDTILNDVTRKEAKDIGMQHVAKVVDNGFDAPSTLLGFCSEEFEELFEKADVIISKGQGNFEGLFQQTDKQNLFCLFMVKCEEIARVTGLTVGDAVVLRG